MAHGAGNQMWTVTYLTGREEIFGRIYEGAGLPAPSI